MTALAAIGLGSNLSHPRRQIARALRALRVLPRTRVVAISPNYRTAPVGVSGPQPDYVNAVALVRTELAPRALLGRLLAIERRHRRRRDARNAPRTLDLDLLLYGRLRLRTERLALPHPRMQARAFVLRPLADIAPHVRIPGHATPARLLRDVAGQRVRRTRRHRST